MARKFVERFKQGARLWQTTNRRQTTDRSCYREMGRYKRNCWRYSDYDLDTL